MGSPLIIISLWKTLTTTEGGRVSSYSILAGPEEGGNADIAAKHESRQILWEIWKRFSPSVDESVSHSDKEHAAHLVATLFGNFVLDNVELVRQLEAAFKETQSTPLDSILSELELRARGWS